MPERSADVWIVQSGDYEQHGIDLVAISVEAAVAAIKERYGPPYRVAWDEPTQDERGDWTLIGRFESVRGYSTEHTTHFEIERWEVAGA